MIRPRGSPGIAFGEVSDGDVPTDPVARSLVSEALGISNGWAVVDQVHGSRIVEATAAGDLGKADGIMTQRRMLPIAVSTADCVPVVIMGSRSRAIVHAGWRGVAAGVVPAAVAMMRDTGDQAHGAVIGPCIGPCCYEVGSDVVDAIGGHESRTKSGSLSVDLGGAVREQLGGVEVKSDGICTMHDSRFHSYRRNTTARRQMTVAWIPQD